MESDGASVQVYKVFACWVSMTLLCFASIHNPVEEGPPHSREGPQCVVLVVKWGEGGRVCG